MSQRSPVPGPTGDTGTTPGRGSAGGTPRWVWVFGIIVVVVALLFFVVMLLPGGHGPRRHAPPGSVAEEPALQSWP